MASAYNNRCLAHNYKGEYDLAVADCDQAIRLDPRMGNAFANRCVANNYKGNYDLAIGDCDQAIRLNPQNATNYSNRCLAQTYKGNYELAMADCDQAIRLSPQSATGFNNRCLVHNSKGEYDLAIADCDQAIRLTPQVSNAFSNRCWAYNGKGEYDRGLADCDRAIQLDPKNASAYNNRCSLYNSRGNYEFALADCDQALRLKPQHANAYSNRGWAYYKKGDRDRALTDLNEAVRLNPRNAVARDKRAQLYLSSGNTTAALDDLNEALRLRADLIRALWNRGQVYEQQGLRSLALADYKRAIEVKAAGAAELDAQNSARAKVLALEITPSTITASAASPMVVAAKPQVPIGRRVALVIGNGAYKAVSPLPNPQRDAASVAAELVRLGFDVMERHDLGIEAMRRALGEFEDKATGADWAFVYYAGHGMELNGRNWLIPVDAHFVRASDAPDELVPLERVLDRVSAARKLRIVVLDACRNNPFLARMVMTGTSTRAVTRGLAGVEPSHGEVVFYAARDGNVALDGSGGNSPFATALVKHMDEEGIELGRFFRKVTSTVLETTSNQQEPFVYGRIPDEDFYFRPPR